MSADNYVVIDKKDDKYLVYNLCASCIEDLDNEIPDYTTNTLNEAVNYGEAKFQPEYGVRFTKVIENGFDTIKPDKLKSKIDEYLKIPGIGQAISDGVELIQRLRLGQLNMVADILKRNCSLYQEGKGPSIDEPLYKALELGEYLKCLEDYGTCEFVDECWVTRKASCKKRKNDENF